MNAGPTWDEVVVSLDRSIERTRRAIASLRHIRFDLDPANDGKRLRPCACGRQWTRQKFCAVCAAEVLAHGQGLGGAVCMGSASSPVAVSDAAAGSLSSVGPAPCGADAGAQSTPRNYPHGSAGDSSKAGGAS